MINQLHSKKMDKRSKNDSYNKTKDDIDFHSLISKCSLICVFKYSRFRAMHTPI